MSTAAELIRRAREGYSRDEPRDSTSSSSDRQYTRGATGTPTGGQFATTAGTAQAKPKSTAKPVAKPVAKKPAPKATAKKPPTTLDQAMTRQYADFGTVSAHTPAGDQRIKDMQALMAGLGIKVAQDGRFGPQMTAAVKALQTKVGSKPTGRVTSSLFHKLQSAAVLSPCARASEGVLFGAADLLRRAREGYNPDQLRAKQGTGIGGRWVSMGAVVAALKGKGHHDAAASLSHLDTPAGGRHVPTHRPASHTPKIARGGDRVKADRLHAEIGRLDEQHAARLHGGSAMVDPEARRQNRLQAERLRSELAPVQARLDTEAAIKADNLETQGVVGDVPEGDHLAAARAHVAGMQGGTPDPQADPVEAKAFDRRARVASSGARALEQSHFQARGPAAQALDDYRADSAARANGVLREHGGDLTRLSKDDRRVVEELDRVIASSQPTKRELVVYRGLRSGERTFGNQDPAVGFEFTDHAFVATTAGDSAVDLWTGDSGVEMRILVPAGTKAISNPDFLDDDEVLLGRGHRFRVVNDRGRSGGVRRLDVEVVSGEGVPAKKATKGAALPTPGPPDPRAEMAALDKRVAEIHGDPSGFDSARMAELDTLQARRRELSAAQRPKTAEAAPFVPRSPAVDSAIRAEVARLTGRTDLPSGGMFVGNPDWGIPMTDMHQMFRSNGNVYIADLRDALGEKYSRAEVDAALMDMATDPSIRLTPIAASTSLSQRDRDSALHMGGGDVNLIKLETPEALPAWRGAPSAAKAAPKKTAAAKMARAKAATPDPTETVAAMRSASSRDEAAKHLEGRSVSDLKAIAASGGIAVGPRDTKAKLKATIVQWTAGQRLDSGAISRPGPSSISPGATADHAVHQQMGYDITPFGEPTMPSPTPARKTAAQKMAKAKAAVDHTSIVGALEQAGNREEGLAILAPLAVGDLRAIAKSAGMTGVSRTGKQDLIHQIVALTIGGRLSFAAMHTV